MKHDKRSAHFGRDRTGTRWCASGWHLHGPGVSVRLLRMER